MQIRFQIYMLDRFDLIIRSKIFQIVMVKIYDQSKNIAVCEK